MPLFIKNNPVWIVLKVFPCSENKGFVFHCSTHQTKYGKTRKIKNKKLTWISNFYKNMLSNLAVIMKQKSKTIDLILNPAAF